MGIDINKTTTFNFRGQTYQCVDVGPENPAFGTDEVDVKNRHWHIKPGEVILDIGAAHGSYALTALAQGAAKVYGWAPEGHYEFLKRNIELNNWQDRGIAISTGLWSKTGWLRTDPRGPGFRETEPEPEKGTFTNYYGLPVEEPQVGPWFRVEALDETIVAQEPKLDFWKLDVEAAELEVLRGGEKLLRKHRPRLLIENHIQYVPSIYEDVKRFLLGLNIGYKEICTVPSGSYSHSFYQVDP